jgi:hypothetical protein
MSVSLYAGIPSLMISNIWWAPNNAIFKDKTVLPKVTTTITPSQASELKEDPKSKKQCNLTLPSMDYGIPWGFFDRASQGHLPKCGVRVILYVNQNHYIYIIYAPGGGTNNRVELKTLWTLLETTKQKDVWKLQVLGDSKLVIEWA